MPGEGIEKLAALLAAARKVLIFTGAGVSTGSGIPDYRGPQGVWRRRQPVYYQEFLSSEEKRVEYWNFALAGDVADFFPPAVELACSCMRPARP